MYYGDKIDQEGCSGSGGSSNRNQEDSKERNRSAGRAGKRNRPSSCKNIDICRTRKAKKEEKAKEASVSVVFEFADKKVVAKELLAKAKEAFSAAHKDVVVEEMNLYINANDGYAYLVVNGTEYPEDKIEL